MITVTGRIKIVQMKTREVMGSVTNVSEFGSDGTSCLLTVHRPKQDTQPPTTPERGDTVLSQDPYAWRHFLQSTIIEGDYLYAVDVIKS